MPLSKTPLSKTGAAGFGIRVNGRDVGMTFATAAEAHDSAVRLRSHRFKSVIVFDRRSGLAIAHAGAPRATPVAVAQATRLLS